MLKNLLKYIKKESGFNLKKLVLKTIAFTLVGIILLGGILFGAFALFSPKTIASISEQLGSKSVAIHFYGLQYNKTGSTDDLGKYISVMGLDADAETLQKYSSELVAREDFEDFCKNNGAVLYGNEQNSAEYYYLCLAKSEYLLGNTQASVSACQNFIINI